MRLGRTSFPHRRHAGSLQTALTESRIPFAASRAAVRSPPGPRLGGIRAGLRRVVAPLAGRWGALLVAGQLLIIAGMGASTVDRFRVWAQIDEAQHYSYVQYIAEEGRLPVVGRDLVSPAVIAIGNGTYPSLENADPRAYGLFGQSYEGQQPPLYYVVAAPVFLASGDYMDKVFALRAFDLALVGVAIVLLWRLSRRVFRARWLPPFSLALAFLMWPGVLVRAVTVSTTALELVLTVLFLLTVWKALDDRSERWLVASGAVLGLCLLTKLTLLALAPVFLVAIVLVLRRRPVRRAVARGALAVALPALMLLPWIVFNYDHYGSATPMHRANELLSEVNNPTHADVTIADIPGKAGELVEGVLPQEWNSQHHDALVLVIAVVVQLLTVAVPVALTVRFRRLLRTRYALVFALPLPVGIVLMLWTFVVDDWKILLARYLYPLLLGFTFFAAVAWRALRDSDGVVLAVSGVTSLALAVLWAHLAGTYYFLNVGHALGL
jgi:4-amino-4-deoxy-L-arabinose transferase-like glycosyltransferase